jgi:large subunit ribosomal protein L6e
MSATLEATRHAGQKKTFGKSTREVPHHTQKAQKWYPAEDEVVPKKVGLSYSQYKIFSCCNCWLSDGILECAIAIALQIPQSTATRNQLQELQLIEYSQVRKSIRTSSPRESLTPGAVLILLAGRFRGKRVILLKNLSQGVLLVTGPFKVNGVPLRRVNARYVIATSHKVDLAGIDQKKVDQVAGDKYFAREKGDKKKGEEAFFKQGEKPEVRLPHSR